MNIAPVWEPHYCSGFAIPLGRKQKELHAFLSNPDLRDTPRLVIFKNAATNRAKISEFGRDVIVFQAIFHKNKSLNVPASAFTGSSITGRVEAAVPNNFRAVAEAGKSFRWLRKLDTNTPAMTATAMLIASTAGLRIIFFQVHREAGTRSFSENHSADSAGMGIRRTTCATARSKFCWLIKSAEPSTRDIAARMERSTD